MPLPRPPDKKLKEVPQLVWPGLCCIPTPDDTLQATLVPSEPASARPTSEVNFTPRTPTGPPPAPCNQLLEFESRLQRSISLTMELQYKKLSGELLDILQCGQQRTALRASGRANGSARVRLASATSGANEKSSSVKSSLSAEKDIRPTTPDGSPPLLMVEQSTQSLVNGSPHPRQNLNEAVEDFGKSQRADQNGANPQLGIVQPQKGEVVMPQLQKGGVSKRVGSQKLCTQPNGHQRAGLSPVACEPGSMETSPSIGTSKSIGIEMSYGKSLTGSSQGSSKQLKRQIGNDLAAASELREKEKKLEGKAKRKFKTLKAMERNAETGELIKQSLGRRILQNPLSDSLCAMAIVLNSVLIGISAEWLTTHDEETTLLIILGLLCNIFFFCELIFRLCVYRLEYFTNEDKVWNVFDFLLVLFSVIDIIMWAVLGNSGAGSVGSTLKIVKMLRIVRIFRVFRFFRELSLLAIMIIDSLRSLVWAGIMLLIIIYVFAICFTQNATEFVKGLDENNISQMDSMVFTLFGSLPKTIYSLVLSMLGGVSWGEVSDVLMHMDALSATLFFFYISFSVLAVLNVITAVFVDNAVETARGEREFLIQNTIEVREKLLGEMRTFFEEMDEDKSGSVSFQELQTYFDDKRVQSYFQALGLDPSDAERLFRLIDMDGSGEVQVAEFLDGCLRLKGEARSIDVNAILWQCHKIQARLDELSSNFNGLLPVEQG